MFEAITGAVSALVGSILSPIVAMGPTVSIFVVASMITVIVTSINKIMTTESMKNVKKEMKDVRERMKSAQKNGDKAESEKLLTRMMEMNGEFMKHSYKSLFVSMLVVFLFLPWIKSEYTGMTVASMPFEMPLVGSDLGWISWYILVSFTMGWVIRKVLGFD